MTRPRSILIGIGVFLLVLIALLFILANSSWLRGFVERKASEATGREVQIGALDVSFGRCLRIAVDDLRMSNPEWARDDKLVEARSIRACVAWAPLFVGRVHVKQLDLAGTRVGLERQGDRATWELDKEQKDEKEESRFSVGLVNAEDTQIAFLDAAEKTDLKVALAGGYGNEQELSLHVEGKFRNATIEAVVQGPPNLPSPETPVTLSAAVVLGRTTAATAGRFTSLGAEHIDALLNIAGDDLSDLNRLGINLPATPPYKLRGRLRSEPNVWHVEQLEGGIGDSDVSGSVNYTKKEPRPLLAMDLYAHLLDFDDLGPLVGAPPRTTPGETASPDQKKKADKIDPNAGVLPDKPLGIDKWPKMDAIARFRADRIKRPDALPIEALEAHLKIDNAKLSIKPLNFQMAGGKIISDIAIEGKEQPPRATANFDVRALRLERMFPKMETERAAAGALYGRASFKASGNSIAQLFGSADGDLALMVNGGHMSNLLLELAGLDAAEAVRILATKDKPVPLRCAIVDLKVKNGVAGTELFAIDTVDTLFLASGSVDLRNEKLDLKITPQPKDGSLFAARTPLTVGGTLGDPSVGVKAGPLIARGVAAAAISAAAPFLAFLPFIETGPGEDQDCRTFLARVKETPRQQPGPKADDVGSQSQNSAPASSR